MTEKKKIKIYCGFPSNGNIVDAQVYQLRRMQEIYADHVELVYPDVCVHRIFHDAARNAIVEDFLATDCDILWFLDSDICPHTHVLDLVVLHGDKWKVAGAPYPVFMSQPGEDFRQIVFTVYKGSSETGLRPTNIPESGTEFVDGIATGCLFIKREVLEKLEKPYFEFKYDAESRALIGGEDIGFCLKLMKQGIKFFVDYSLVCKHYKHVCLLEMNNYAIEYAKKAVAAYDRDIRGKVAELAAKLTGKMSPTPQSKSQLILPNGR